MSDTLESRKSTYFPGEGICTQVRQATGASDDAVTIQPPLRHEQARVDLAAVPSRISANEAESPTFCTRRERGPLLLKARIFLRGVIRHQQQDDIVKHYEGSSWCDSTERELNYDIMTGRGTRSW